MTGIIPDTNDVQVALIAVAWAIITEQANITADKEHKTPDAAWYTAKFDEVYKQLLKTIQSP